MDGRGREGRGAERREWMRGGDDNGVGWLIREGCVSRGGTKGRKRRDEVEGRSGAGANQPLSTPPIRDGHALWGSRSRFLLVPVCSPSHPHPVVSFTPTEIIVIGVARRDVCMGSRVHAAICAATRRLVLGICAAFFGDTDRSANVGLPSF